MHAKLVLCMEMPSVYHPMTKKLLITFSTIQKCLERKANKKKRKKKEELSLKDEYIYEGFDEDGNRIAQIILRKNRSGPVGLYSHFPEIRQRPAQFISM